MTLDNTPAPEMATFTPEQIAFINGLIATAMAMRPRPRQYGKRGRPLKQGVVSFERIIFQAEKIFRLTRQELISKSRTARICRVRNAVYLAMHRSGWSLAQIGAALGGRDHTTVGHGIENAKAECALNKRYADAIFELTAQ